MQSIPFYIAYLLTKHECVIVQGLGAFIVSGSEESKDKKAGLLCPPGRFLGFNPDIRHNDGLLANTLAKGENISYREACLHIGRYVERITDSMEKQILVQLPWIGRLELPAKRKILFTPASYLSCNVNTFGMDNFYMSPIYELYAQEEHPIQSTVRPEPQAPIVLPAKQSIVRRYLAIAATIIGLLMIAIPVNDHSMQQSQMATIISLPTITSTETEVAQPEEELSIESNVELSEESTKELTKEPMEEPVEEPAKKPVEEPAKEITPYYIVISSLPTESSAQIQMAQFQKEGFSSAGIISAGNKHRIYIAKFSDKTEANTFLARFRTEHPQHSDAWLLIQRI